MAPELKLNLVFFFLVFIVQAWTQDPQPPEVMAAVGGVTFLNPKLDPQNPVNYSQIHWRWKNQVKIAIRKFGEEPSYPQTRFLGRLELLANHTLKMSRLELGDSGEFRLYLENQWGRESVHSVRLKVYEIVPKPHVTATTNGDPQHCNATLNCSVSLPEVTYEWISPQKLRGEAGPVLRVTPNPDGDTYVCRATNPVSSSNASLTYRHPCTWTGESSFSSVTCATPSVLLALGNLIVLILLLTVA